MYAVFQSRESILLFEFEVKALNGCCKADKMRIDFWAHSSELIAYTEPIVPDSISSVFFGKRYFGVIFLKKQLNVWQTLFAYKKNGSLEI